MKKEYYVYIYLDPRKKGIYQYDEFVFDYEPFYVGKGNGKRYLKHLLETKLNTSNLFKFRVINKIRKIGLEPIIIKIKEKLFEDYAYELESRVIELIGKRCDNVGPLTNILNDNRPPSNYIKLSDDVIRKIITLYKNGMYLKHIGDELDLNENKIKRTLIENGIKPKRKAPLNKVKINNSNLKDIINDYENGLSIRKIKTKYGLSYEVVRKNLKKSGVELRGYDYPRTKEHIENFKKSRVYVSGEDNPCYKTLGDVELDKLYKLRFVEGRKIRDILKIMKISQKKYYEYINKLKK